MKPLMLFARLISALSVRSRIAALALIPVVGFMAFGMAYTARERAVASAFDGVKGSAALAEASREFKAALATMRTTASEFGAHPSADLATEFLAAHEIAASRLSTIREMVDDGLRADTATFETTVKSLKDRFTILAEEQEKFGFSDREGLRG